MLTSMIGFEFFGHREEKIDIVRNIQLVQQRCCDYGGNHMVPNRFVGDEKHDYCCWSYWYRFEIVEDCSKQDLFCSMIKFIKVLCFQNLTIDSNRGSACPYHPSPAI